MARRRRKHSRKHAKGFKIVTSGSGRKYRKNLKTGKSKLISGGKRRKHAKKRRPAKRRKHAKRRKSSKYFW